VDAVTDHRASGRLHLALVTETCAPDVNGVAMTSGRLVDGLLSAHQRISIFRPGLRREHHRLPVRRAYRV